MTHLQPEPSVETDVTEVIVAISILGIVCVGVPVLFGLVAFVVWLFSSGGPKEN
jgi:hypothetical protein